MSLGRCEATRLEIQAALDAERSAAERNEWGQFATPPALADEIVKVALDYLDAERPGVPVRFLDPTIGSGSFFSALLRQLPRERIEYAAGVELDPRFVAAARELWSAYGLDVKNGDFTRLRPAANQRVNLLVANPPYVRHHHLDAEEKVRMQHLEKGRLGITVSGLAGLYLHILLLSHEWVEPDGISAWLIPSEWMSVNYGLALRRYLQEHVTLLRIHRFDADDVQFGDALVSSSVIFFRLRKPSRATAVSLTAGGSLREPAHARAVALTDLAPGKKWLPLFEREHRVCPTDGLTIGDLFAIRRGIATGKNTFFIRPRHEWAELGVPEEALCPILPPARAIGSEVIEAAPDGYPALDPTLALLDCRLTQEVVEREHHALWKYLNSAEADPARESYLARHREPWYSQEDREPAPFLSTYMGRGSNGGTPFRIFWNRSRAIATNVFLMLYPKGPLAAMLQQDPEQGREVARILQEIITEHHRRHGRVYGGALYKLEPKELAALPVNQLVEALGLEVREPQQAQLALL